MRRLTVGLFEVLAGATSHSRRMLLLAALCPSLVPSVALGAPLLTLQGNAEAKASVPLGSIIDADSSYLTAGATIGFVTDSLQVQSTGEIGGRQTTANAGFDGRAEFGELRGSAFAGAIGGTAYAQVRLAWQDDFIATSSTLASGTPVSYAFTITLSSAIFTNRSCDGVSPPGPASASLIGLGGAGGIVVDRACGEPLVDRSVRTILDTTIGSVFPIRGELVLSASVGSSAASLPDNQAIADASNTGRFYLDPIGSNYSYRTNSGRTYFTPIPEPASGLLLGAAVAGVAGLRRTRGSRS